MRSNQIPALVTVSVLTSSWLMPGIANAASISVSSEIEPTIADFETAVTIDQFNPSLGNLDSLTFELTGIVEAFAGVENLSDAATVITADLNALLQLQDPNGLTLVQTAPAAIASTELLAFDQAIDFAGPSGVVFPILADNASNIQTFTLSDGLDFSPFVGDSTIDLIFLADINFPIGSAGDTPLETTTLVTAAGELTVTFNFTELESVAPSVSVPEPMAALISGLVICLGLATHKPQLQSE
ncbi:MAG: choice-of-anchor E domain-containing protein [Cyanothece sp. SIO1E1]|nr:choice-of-anchor E domain-containing protein [Cyanothece sp. SIO1E1]